MYTVQGDLVCKEDTKEDTIEHFAYSITKSNSNSNSNNNSRLLQHYGFAPTPARAPAPAPRAPAPARGHVPPPSNFCSNCPPGSYRGSCPLNTCTFINNSLSCRCMGRNGSLVPTSLGFCHRKNDIKNNNGTLKCG